MKRIQIISIAVLIIALVVLSGCKKAGKDEQEMPERITLEEVRKQVVEKEGLDINHLTSDNEKYIERIHERMNYISNKYDKDFCYDSYYLGSLLNTRNRLYLYPKGGDPEKDIFVVASYREGDTLIIEDSYMRVALSDKYSEYIEKTVKSFNKKARVVVFSRTSRVHDKERTKVPETLSELDGLVSGFNDIFISDKNVSEEEYDRIVEEFKKWSVKHKMSTDTDIFYIRDEDMHDLNSESGSDFLGSKNYIKTDYIIIQDHDWE